MEDTTMIKKEYLKFFEADEEQNLLLVSVTSVSTTGLDTDDRLELPGDGQSTTGSVWDEAW